MKHRIKLRKLSRTSAHRRALFRNQVTSLIEHERIETTVAKAKELRRIAEKLITTAKQGTLRAHRAVDGYVQTKMARRKLFVELAPRFMGRSGGYTRVLRTRLRRGDCAPMAVIELSETDNSILTAAQLVQREARKSKYRRNPELTPPSLANALD